MCVRIVLSISIMCMMFMIVFSIRRRMIMFIIHMIIRRGIIRRICNRLRCCIRSIRMFMSSVSVMVMIRIISMCVMISITRISMRCS